ncbi:MAG: type II toxin-antitoxin system prevent-host-death family antitoxin [Opitutales bacterium]|nr:type II toxin-antitoxin system prevent-host-death family antitoxin [Opitutales bacterium]
MDKVYTVGEFKARFPEALEAVRRGERVEITYGRGRRTVAVLSPPPAQKQARKLGRLRGKIKVGVADDWKLDDASFLDS